MDETELVRTTPTPRRVNTLHRRVFHIPSLDGLRAVAAMLVFLAHAGLSNLVPGGFGVTIFFFLSGYLITTLLRIEFERTGTVSFKNFYLRRAYRIFPPLYIVLGILFLVSVLTGPVNEILPWAVFAQITHWTNYYFVMFGGNNFVPFTSVYWSLAIEEHFYLIFPLMSAYGLKRRDYHYVAAIIVAICFFALAWRAFLVLHINVSESYIYRATDTRFDSLLFGCLLGVWRNPVLDADFRCSPFSRKLFLVGALGLLVFTLIFRNDAFRSTVRYSLQGAALLPVFWLAIRHSDWLCFRWLNWQAVRFLGQISYTFYLCHMAMLHYAEHILGESISAGILGFFFAFMFSTGMYFLVEQRFGELRKRLHRA